MPKTYSLTVNEMSCPSCARPVKTTLLKYFEEKKIKVLNVGVNVWTNRAWIIVDDTVLPHGVEDDLKERLDDVGFPCDAITSFTFAKKIYGHLSKGLLASVFGLVLLALSMAGIMLPFIALAVVAGLASIVTLYVGKDTYVEAFKQFRKTKSLMMSALLTVSTMVALIVSVVSLFLSGFPLLFDAALLILGFRHLGKAIEENAKLKCLSDMSIRHYVLSEVELIENPNAAPADWIIKSYETKALKPGDVIRIRSGQKIPVDGECLDEQSSVYETILTGKTIPSSIKKGAKLEAEMRVAEHVRFITMKVTATEANSSLAHSDNRIEEDKANQPPLEMIVDTISRYFVPAIFALALIAGLCVGFLLNPFLALQTVISVIAAACPCFLALGTPLAVESGLRKASKHAIHFKGSNTLQALQAAAKVNAIVFDFNGTLTEGKYKVTDFKIAEDEKISPAEFFSYFHALEKNREHSIAQEICSYAKRQDIKDIEVTDDKYEAGRIEAKIQDQLYEVSDKKGMEESGIDTSQYETVIASHHGAQVIFIARGKKIIGYIILQDSLRKDAKLTLDQLRNRDKKTEIFICSGSDINILRPFAKELEVDEKNIKANCRGSQSKRDFIVALKEGGYTVAMVGDGINDREAVAASCGIAVQSPVASLETQQEAGIVIRDAKDVSLWPVAKAFMIADQTDSNIKQNLAISLACNMTSLLITCGILLLVGFAINPAVGAALMLLQIAFVLFNTYRIQKKTLPDVASTALSAALLKGQSSCRVAKTLGFTPQPIKDYAISQTTCAPTESSWKFLVTRVEPGAAVAGAPPLCMKKCS